MENDAELNAQGKYLGSITQDFAKVSDTLKEASYQMRVRKISNYPIFPVAKESLQWASLLLGKDEAQTEWHYFISMLEEFLGRGLVEKEHLTDFQLTYKDPDEYCCLFVVDQSFINFVYIPYPDDDSDSQPL